MNTPAGIISVMATIARPESTMQPRYSLCMARRYRVFMARKRPPKLSPGRPVFQDGVLLRVPDALDETRVFRAVLVAHRLRRLEEGFLVRRDELDACRL